MTSVYTQWSILTLGILGSALMISDASAAEGSTYNLGVEGFYDNYREPHSAEDVTSDTTYGSVDGTYMYTTSDNAFYAVDGRVSRGRDNYSSGSGKIDGIPEWESELRVRAGGNMQFWDNTETLSPYIGLGARYFDQEGKGEVTNLGAFGYDRRITQFYIPIGATYTFSPAQSWTNAVNVEVDPMFFGNVNSRLGTTPGYYNVNNTQFMDGFGLRGSYMIGQPNSNGIGWEAGPFIRYWHVSDSNVLHTANLPADEGYEEPQNQRTQIGVALRATW